MAIRQEAKGKALGRIITLPEGLKIIFQVVDVRSTSGEYEGHLIDCITAGGVAFSVNGHKILKDKVEEYWLGSPEWFEVEKSGKVGRAVFYEVSRLNCTTDELLADEDERSALNDSEAYVKGALDALPSSDDR